mgnify:CR=1 FL=1
MEEIIVEAIGEGVVTKGSSSACFSRCGTCGGIGGNYQFNVAMSRYSYY